MTVRNSTTAGPVTSFAYSNILAVPGPEGPPGPAGQAAAGAFVVGGDLTGTSGAQTVAKIQNVPVLSGTPADGYVLTYSASHGQWEPKATAATFVAAGDLSGSSSSQQVTGLASHALPSLTTGYLNYTGSGWALTALPTSFAPSGTAGGDLGGSYPNPAVAKIQGSSVSGSAPTKGQLFIATGAGTWGPVTVSGDVAASATTPGALTVTGLQGKAVPTPTVAGTSLTYDGAALSWGGAYPLGPNAAWAVTDWYINGATGDDTHAGTSSGTALKTFRRLAQIWGTVEPVLTSAVTLHVAAHTDAADPVILRPFFAQGGSLTVVCALVSVATGTLGTITAKNRPLGHLLKSDLTSAAAGTSSLMLVNTARSSSVCWVDALAGTVATLSQPVAQNAVTLGHSPTEDDGYTTGNAFTVYEPGKIVLGEFTPRQATAVNEVPLDGGDYGYLVNAWVLNTCPDDLGESKTMLGRGVRATQCRFDSFVQHVDTQIGAEGNFVNCQLLGGCNLISTFVQAGIIANGAVNGTQLSGVFDCDVILHGVIALNKAIFDSNILGWVYSDAADLSIAGDTFLAGATDDNGGIGTTGILWGPMQLDLSQTGAVLTYNAPAATAFTGGLTFFPAFASATDYSLDPAPVHPARALTPSQLDASVASGGFAGNARFDTGALITDGIQSSAAPTPRALTGPTASNVNTGVDISTTVAVTPGASASITAPRDGFVIAVVGFMFRNFSAAAWQGQYGIGQASGAFDRAKPITVLGRQPVGDPPSEADCGACLIHRVAVFAGTTHTFYAQGNNVSGTTTPGSFTFNSEILLQFVDA